MGNPSRIDDLYRSFCEALPPEQSVLAGDLAYRLKLVPAPGIAWSAVFKHPVTLQAPAFFVHEGVTVSDRIVDRATLAHMLSIIEAFGTDRIADRQTEDDPELRALLDAIRGARDAALFEVGGTDAVDAAARADRLTTESIDAERQVLLEGAPVGFATYERISAGKQAVGLPSTLALARVAGLDEAQLETVRASLLGIWLGLQFQDDVVDWEEDLARGGAWAVALARQAKGPDEGLLSQKYSAAGLTEVLGGSASSVGAFAPPRSELNASDVRNLVFSSGVLAQMLERSLLQFQIAASGADALGSRRLWLWLRERETETRQYVEGERRSPGYLVRLKKLSPWAQEVLA